MVSPLSLFTCTFFSDHAIKNSDYCCSSLILMALCQVCFLIPSRGSILSGPSSMRSRRVFESGAVTVINKSLCDGNEIAYCQLMWPGRNCNYPTSVLSLLLPGNEKSVFPKHFVIGILNRGNAHVMINLPYTS